MKKQRIAKGQPLDELVKGSLNYTLERIRTAFRAQFRSEDAYWNWYIAEAFADHIIVMDDQLPPDEFYRVSYTAQGASYVFAARDVWEVVELAYQSRTVQERRISPVAALRELTEGAVVELAEAEVGKPRRIKAVGMTAGIINNNSRRYPSDVLEAAVDEARAKMHSGALQLLGEVDHPSDKGGIPSALESVVLWDSLTFDGTQTRLEGTIIETSKGRDLITLLDSGVRPRLSQRARGKSVRLTENNRTFDEITELHISGYDLVMEPGDPTAGILTVENQQSTKEDPRTMDLEKLRAQYPDLVAQIEREHDETRRKQLEQALQERQHADAERQRAVNEHNATLRQQLGLKETDNLEEAVSRQAAELKRLQEAEQIRAVATYIEQETAGVKYADVLKTQFVERIKAANPKTIEEAKATIITARKEYDAIQSGLELGARGHGGLQAVGPVLERERGVPEFARASFELTESLIRAGHVQPRDLRQPKSINERFAQQYLERFDRAYRHHLTNEARLFNEAEQASDLNLPYSVTRAIIGEALPELVAVSIFDVQLVDLAPTTNIWFEAYSAESGAVGTVTDEVVVADLNAWVSLANKRLQPGTVVLTNSGASVTYVEGSDYIIDYANGRMMALATITDNQSLKIDYSYDAMRRGEMAAIKRGKNTLSSMALSIAADRLATEISTEAIAFSRATLGYDARSRTVMRLVRQIQQKIDGGLFYLALAAALRVASNSGGTWTAASDDVVELVQKIGVAKVKIANRNYEPTAVLMSKTNSDRLANWDGFTAAGMRPDADLSSAGYVGRVKGLPVFDTSNFTDGYIMPVNREVVLHRVGQPMQIKGPFPSYNSGELVAAEQWYAEEFNGSETPVAEKASYVKVA